MKIGILWTRKELSEFSCAFNGGGGGGNSTSSTQPRNVAQLIRLAVEHWTAAAEHPVFLSPAQTMRVTLAAAHRLAEMACPD